MEETECTYITKRKYSIKFITALNCITLAMCIVLIITGGPLPLIGFTSLNILLGISVIAIDRRDIEIYELKNKK